MTGFSDRDIRNEIARIFKSDIDFAREKGVVDPDSVYSQTMDVASLTFLTNPDAIFYLTQLATNGLLAAVKKEVSLVEGMLFAIDYVSNNPPDYRDAGTELNNATTALLALDATSSVKNRLELGRFTKNITKFSERLRRTTARSGSLALAAGESKWSIREDMVQLETQHATVLERIDLLISLFENYENLDVTSLAAQTLLSNVRLSIDRVRSTLERDSVAGIEEKTKSILLRSLAGKASVNYLSDQQPPTLVRYRGPSNPIDSGVFYGRVAGEGESAVIETSSGPWETPLTDLTLSVNGGTAQVFALGDIPGVSLVTRNKEDFGVSANNQLLCIAVDPESYDFYTSFMWFSQNTTTLLRLHKAGQDPFRSIGFKHLGAPLYLSAAFLDPTVLDEFKWDNLFPAVITDLGLLANGGSPATWNAGTGEFTVASLTDVNAAPGAAVFGSEDIGRYIKDSGGNRFEIVGVTGSLTAVLATYGGTPALGASELRGQDGPLVSHTEQMDAHSSDQPLTVEFSPALTSTPDPAHDPEWKGELVTIGPSVKRGTLDTGDRTAVQVANDLNTLGSGNVDNYLYRHVLAAPAVSDAEKVQLTPYSQVNGKLRVVTAALTVNSTTRESAYFSEGPAYQTLGFYLGLEDSDTIVQPQELADFLNATLTGAVAEVVDEVLYEGSARTLFDTKQLEDTAASFLTLGVVAGYQVEILDGLAAGYYRVDAVPDATHLTLRRDNFVAHADVAYRVLAQRVRISTVSKTRGASLKVTAAPATLSLPAEMQYGATQLFEAVDRDGSSLAFEKVKVGDILTLGEVGDLTITVPGTYQLEVEGLIPTGVVDAQFSIQNAAYQAYQTLKTDLTVFRDSRALLSKHKLSTGLGELDAAISPVVASGSFAAATNRATRILADLLSFMTNSPLRAEEYSTSIPQASMTLSDILNAFSAVEVPALKALADDMRGRGYERSVDMLLKGDVTGFFGADSEDASYSGAMTKATRTVLQDLPDVSTDEVEFGAEGNEPLEDFENPEDPDYYFEEDDEWDDDAEDDGDY